MSYSHGPNIKHAEKIYCNAMLLKALKKAVWQIKN
jgi:hypothetical protein